MTSNTTGERCSGLTKVTLSSCNLRVFKSQSKRKMLTEATPLYQDPETAGLAGSCQSLALDFQNKTNTSQEIKNRRKPMPANLFPTRKQALKNQVNWPRPGG